MFARSEKVHYEFYSYTTKQKQQDLAKSKGQLPSFKLFYFLAASDTVDSSLPSLIPFSSLSFWNMILSYWHQPILLSNLPKSLFFLLILTYWRNPTGSSLHASSLLLLTLMHYQVIPSSPSIPQWLPHIFSPGLQPCLTA